MGLGCELLAAFHDFFGILIVDSVVRTFKLDSLALYLLFLFETFKFSDDGTGALVGGFLRANAMDTVESDGFDGVGREFELVHYEVCY